MLKMFNIHRSMLAASEENERLLLKMQMLETRNEELELACVGMLDLKTENRISGKQRQV